MTQDNTPAAPKMALCIRHHHAPLQTELLKECAVFDVNHAFWLTPVELADRAACETDESLLQLIPYVMAIDPESPGRVFAYSRGDGGDEDRLHGVLSVGLGGHVDTPPPPPYSNLLEHMAAEACRELSEEVGVAAKAREIVFAGAAIYNPADAVGRVHLGLLCAISAGPQRFGAAEAGVIERGQWLTLEELSRHATYDRLEPWSKAAVRYMLASR